jgi:hypothetical protein
MEDRGELVRPDVASMAGILQVVVAAVARGNFYGRLDCALGGFCFLAPPFRVVVFVC